MRLDKYISLSLFSINSYFVVAGILYVYCGYKLIDKIFPKFYMSIQTLCSIYSLLMYLNILLLILFCVEKYIRKKFPGLLFKMNFKDKAVRLSYRHHSFSIIMLDTLAVSLNIKIYFSAKMSGASILYHLYSKSVNVRILSEIISDFSLFSGMKNFNKGII